MQRLNIHLVAPAVLEAHFTQTYGTDDPWPYGLTLLAIEYEMRQAVREAIEAGTAQEIEPLEVQTFGGVLGLTEEMSESIVRRRINQERDRRIFAGFEFEGKGFDYDAVSKSRITGAATLAGFAQVNGAVVDDLTWHGGSEPFTWIAQDNSLVTMDAQTCFAFGEAAANHESDHIFAALALKNSEVPVEDFADDTHWP